MLTWGLSWTCGKTLNAKNLEVHILSFGRAVTYKFGVNSGCPRIKQLWRHSLKLRPQLQHSPIFAGSAEVPVHGHVRADSGASSHMPQKRHHCSFPRTLGDIVPSNQTRFTFSLIFLCLHHPKSNRKVRLTVLVNIHSKLQLEISFLNFQWAHYSRKHSLITCHIWASTTVDALKSLLTCFHCVSEFICSWTRNLPCSVLYSKTTVER